MRKQPDGATRRKLLATLGVAGSGLIAPRLISDQDTALAQRASPPAGPNIREISLVAERTARKLDPAKPAESVLFRLRDVHVPEGTALPNLPVLRARQGETLRLVIENRLGQATSFHLRGFRGPNTIDGIAGLTSQPLAQGERATLEFNAHQAGTFLLSPALPETLAEQRARGLAAILIVEEPSPPPVDHDLVIAAGDWRIGEDGQLDTDFMALRDAARLGRLGNRLAVNGEIGPGRIEVAPNTRLRVRLVNTSSARMLPIKVTNLAAQVIAIDSTPCQPFDPLKRTVMLAPSSRIDMILDCPAEAGQHAAVEAKLGDGIPFFRIETKGAPLTPRGKVAALPDPGLPPAIRLQAATRIELAITGGAGTAPAEWEPHALKTAFPAPSRIFQINAGAKPLGLGAPPFATLKRGAVLVLTLRNQTNWPQVMAMHGHAFRLLHAYDDGWEPYFLDTLYMAPRTSAIMALIAETPGKWALRSTVAEHFAGGVAAWFQITG